LFAFSAASKVASPPVFLISPRNTKVSSEGSSVTLDCAANGVPKPYVTWLKDGATIDLNHLDSRFLRIGEGSLQIKNVRVEDKGTYQCRAENSEDSVDAAAILEVQVAPRVLRRPQNVVSVEKGDIEFECEVYSVPQSTIQWYKNGDLIIESEYFQVKDFT
jgi:neogenin